MQNVQPLTIRLLIPNNFCFCPLNKITFVLDTYNPLIIFFSTYRDYVQEYNDTYGLYSGFNSHIDKTKHVVSTSFCTSFFFPLLHNITMSWNYFLQTDSGHYTILLLAYVYVDLYLFNVSIPKRCSHYRTQLFFMYSSIASIYNHIMRNTSSLVPRASHGGTC